MSLLTPSPPLPLYILNAAIAQLRVNTGSFPTRDANQRRTVRLCLSLNVEQGGNGFCVDPCRFVSLAGKLPADEKVRV